MNMSARGHKEKFALLFVACADALISMLFVYCVWRRPLPQRHSVRICKLRIQKLKISKLKLPKLKISKLKFPKLKIPKLNITKLKILS